jgi:hypothetical protein
VPIESKSRICMSRFLQGCRIGAIALLLNPTLAAADFLDLFTTSVGSKMLPGKSDNSVARSKLSNGVWSGSSGSSGSAGSACDTADGSSRTLTVGCPPANTAICPTAGAPAASISRGYLNGVTQPAQTLMQRSFANPAGLAANLKSAIPVYYPGRPFMTYQDPAIDSYFFEFWDPQDLNPSPGSPDEICAAKLTLKMRGNDAMMITDSFKLSGIPFSINDPAVIASMLQGYSGRYYGLRIGQPANPADPTVLDPELIRQYFGSIDPSTAPIEVTLWLNDLRWYGTNRKNIIPDIQKNGNLMLYIQDDTQIYSTRLEIYRKASGQPVIIKPASITEQNNFQSKIAADSSSVQVSEQ